MLFGELVVNYMRTFSPFVGFLVRVVSRVEPDGLSAPGAVKFVLVCSLWFIFEDVLVPTYTERVLVRAGCFVKLNCVTICCRACC